MRWFLLQKVMMLLNQETVDTYTIHRIASLQLESSDQRNSQTYCMLQATTNTEELLLLLYFPNVHQNEQ